MHWSWFDLQMTPKYILDAIWKKIQIDNDLQDKHNQHIEKEIKKKYGKRNR